jgi:hypothetical protein
MILPDNIISTPSKVEFEAVLETCSAVTSWMDPQAEILEISIRGVGNTPTQRLPSDVINCECKCPSEEKKPQKKYDLKNFCPEKYNQTGIFAWDCETRYEAKTSQEATAHDKELATPFSAESPNFIGPTQPLYKDYRLRGYYKDGNFQPGMKAWANDPAWIQWYEWVKTNGIWEKGEEKIGCLKCLCNLNDTLALRFQYLNDGPCGGGHNCDRAVFKFGFAIPKTKEDLEAIETNNTEVIEKCVNWLGTFNLNNSPDGGSKFGNYFPVQRSTILAAMRDWLAPNEYDQDGIPYQPIKLREDCTAYLYIKCNLDGGCHEGIAELTIARQEIVGGVAGSESQRKICVGQGLIPISFEL